MKKIILSIFMTLIVVVACVGGVFTYKYFDLKKEQATESSVMTISEAKSLINKVSRDMGFLKTSSASKTLSVSYKDYNGEKVDYNGYEDFIKSFVLAAKFAFDGEVQKETFYISKASYSMNGITYNGVMKMYFTLSRNVLELHLFDQNSNAEIIIKIDNNANNEHEWIMYMYGNCTLRGENNAALYMEVLAGTNKIDGFSYSELTFSTKPTNIEELTVGNINSLELYDCNVKSGKYLFAEKSGMTSDEILTYSKMTIENVNKQASVNFTDLNTYKNLDFLKSMYEYLGYNVI
jgi:hypothetical protein